jgi:hypothetical protein
VLPPEEFCAVPVWINDEPNVPSMPIQVADASVFVVGCTAGTVQLALTDENWDPESTSMTPAQLRDWATALAPAA